MNDFYTTIKIGRIKLLFYLRPTNMSLGTSHMSFSLKIKSSWIKIDKTFSLQV